MKSIRQTIVDDAPTVVARVLERWNADTAEEPWWNMEHVDADHLHQLVQATADAALEDEPTEDTVRRFILTARDHGRDRRNDGHRDTVVHHEFVLLRRALWADIKEQHGANAASHRAMTRLSMALSHAEIASLHGYHELDLPPDSVARAPERLTQEWLRLLADWPAAG
jgi:hypothetical protein